MIDPLAGGQVLGALPSKERQNYYTELEATLSDEEKVRMEMKGIFRDPYKDRYETKEFVLAYIQRNQQQIVSSASISPQTNLANQAIDVTLDRFHVFRYPGSHKHTIQINFSVEHLVNLAKKGANTDLTKQEILYGYIVEATDGHAVPATGKAIFRGLRIEHELHLEIGIIHIVDRIAENFVEILKSDVMKQGVTLLSTVNPAFSIVSKLILGITEMFRKSRKNLPILNPSIGLLINAADTNPKLREGSYVLVQADAKSFNLEDYHWNPASTLIEHKKRKEELPYNYMIFSIKKSIEA